MAKAAGAAVAIRRAAPNPVRTATKRRMRRMCRMGFITFSFGLRGDLSKASVGRRAAGLPSDVLRISGPGLAGVA